MKDLIGKSLAQYQIIEEIGRGGMAVVYRAYQPSLNRHVAIKVLPPQLTFDTTFVQRFQQEARAAARLQHPNIVTVHDVGEEAGIRYIVMQLLEGQPLNELIRQEGQMGLERVAGIVAQVGSALDYAHEQGFVHRDVKPSNIIVGSDGQATLTDFGIAKAAEGTKLTRTGTVMGTPEYMSPEQAKGEAVSRATDVYSLGIVVYEMLAGRVPFKAESTVAVLHKQAYERPQPVRTHAPRLPRGVDGVLAKALAKQPARRFGSAGELAGALQEVIEGKPFRYVEPELPTIAAPTVGRKRTSWLMPVLGGAVVLVLVAVAAFGLGSRGPTPTPPPPTDVPAVVETTSSSPTAVPPTETPSPAATATVQHTSTPIPVLTAAPSPAPGKPQIVTSHAINVYSGPGSSYVKMGQTAASDTLDIIARNGDSTWWRVCCVAGEPVWIEADLVEVQGDTSDVPVAMVTPPTATPTPIPTSTHTPTPIPTDTPVPPPPATPTRIPTLRVNLAFVGAHADANGREIYVLYEGDPNPHRLTSSPGNDGYPAVSPDRTLIAFEAGRHGDEYGSDIWLMNSDGSNQHRLTPSRDTDAQPAFSPDGRRIAFISTRGGTSQIYLMNLDGSGVTAVPAPGWCFGPSFSPDGRQLVFVSTEDSKVHHVFVINLNGSGLRQITSEPAHYENPSFTPDGQAIIFQSNQFGPREIMRINLNGTGLKNLSGNPADDSQPVLSWDGQRIAFTRVSDSKPHTWIMNADGSNQYQFTDLGLIGEVDPAWAR
jgi:serine/threonine-protein kinase